MRLGQVSQGGCVAAAVAGLVAIGGCSSPPAAVEPAPAMTAAASTGAPLASATAGTAEALPPLPAGEGPAAEACTFRAGEAIRFTRGALLAKQAVGATGTPLDVTADRSAYAIFHRTEVTVVTPDGAKAWSVNAHPSVQARFSPRGDRLAVFDFGVRVLGRDTGQVQYRHDGISPCAVRWLSNDELVYQGEPSQGNGWQAPLVRANLATGKQATLGPERWVTSCAASPDGAWWVLQIHVARGTDEVVLVDGRSGRSRKLADRQARPELVVSPVADRHCWQHGDRPSSVDLRCALSGDDTEELVAAKLSHPTLLFGPAGRRALLSYAVESIDGVETPVELVDFGTCRRHELVGYEAQSGSMPAMTAGGRLLTMGSAMGMYAYDLERGTLHVSPRRPFFVNTPVRGQAEGFFGAGDDPNDLDLYWLALPGP